MFDIEVGSINFKKFKEERSLFLSDEKVQARPGYGVGQGLRDAGSPQPDALPFEAPPHGLRWWHLRPRQQVKEETSHGKGSTSTVSQSSPEPSLPLAVIQSQVPTYPQRRMGSSLLPVGFLLL